MLQRLAAKTPAPGGGFAAGAVGALAAAQAEMALRYSVGKQGEQADAELEAAALSLGEIRRHLLHLAHEDAAAYARYSELKKLDADDPRSAGLAGAKARVLGVPAEALGRCVEIVERLLGVVGLVNPWLASDARIAATLAAAAAECCATNIAVNLSLAGDEEREGLRRGAASGVERAGELAGQITRRLEARAAT